ncbi:MAG TPA: hypothetical protein DCL41_05745 [Bdellovibrionales bacterium]|nr:hypothetical protein [Pseudobdellovibrionaceae bacterium]HAG91352.1 hypothetical protein [Bdellovibrionales bacterium]|tara:strand:+ start:604 stop:1560 length:957 start_codon:yes stop_codon:yes gene_type:complete
MEGRFLKFGFLWKALWIFSGLFALISCSAPDSGSFYYGTMGLGERKLVMTTASGQTYAITRYSESGSFEGLIANTSPASLITRGVAPFDLFHVLVATDGQDGLSKVSLIDGSMTSFVGSSLFSGNIYQIVKDDLRSRYYVIESNGIESFDFNGNRVGNPYIGTTVGSCVLSGPRSLTMTSSGDLAVASYTNNDISVYDVSGDTPTCKNSYTGYGNDRPTAIVGHSDGYLYIGFTTNDRIDRLPEDGSGTPETIYTDTAYVNNPTAMLEMPDGTLLIASDGVDAVVQMDTSGNLINGGIFMKDPFTAAVTQMTFVEGVQ